MNQVDVMQQALDLLDEHGFESYPQAHALREAIAKQPAQREPFGYFKAEPFGWTDCAETDEGAVALYDRPQAREPLTREQVKALTKETGYDAASWQERADFINGIRHAEAAHGIKEQP